MKQVYESYTEEDRAVWRLLYNKQEERLRKGASQAYLKGLELVGFQSEDLPVFEHINSVLHKSTHWQLAVVPGIVPDYTFFELMSQRHFPATTWLRTRRICPYSLLSIWLMLSKSHNLRHIDWFYGGFFG